jgi:hypothetical protein
MKGIWLVKLSSWERVTIFGAKHNDQNEPDGKQNSLCVPPKRRILTELHSATTQKIKTPHSYGSDDLRHTPENVLTLISIEEWCLLGCYAVWLL